MPTDSWLQVAGRGEVRTVAGGGHTKCEQCDPAGLEGVSCMSCCVCTEKVTTVRTLVALLTDVLGEGDGLQR